MAQGRLRCIQGLTVRTKNWIWSTRAITHPSRNLSALGLWNKNTLKPTSMQGNGFTRESLQCYHHDPTMKKTPYDEAFERSISDPNRFWAEAADGLIWHKKWDKVLDDSNPPFSRWFVGGEFNTVYNAVDRHVENGLGDRIALIYDSAMTDTIFKISYAELLKEVSNFAGVLQKHGVSKGDRVLIYMPPIPQAIYAMLASARIGAIHSVVFGGFGSRELSTRIQHGKMR